MRPGLRARLGSALLALALVSLASPASAQVERYVDRPIAEVRLVVGGQASGEAEVRDVVETRVGDRLDPAMVRETIVHLMALSRFESVEADAQETPQGVVLTYTLVPLRTVRAIEFKGQLGIAEDEIRAAIVDRYGASPPPGRAGDIAAAVEELYRDHGYLRPTVTPHVVPQPRPERSTLQFEIAAGPQARITDIAFEGDRRLNRDEVLRRLQLKPQGRYDPADVTSRISSYVASLHGKGFYEANVAVTPKPSADGDAVALAVTATRGPRVEVQVRGVDIPADKRKELVPVGKENAVDTDLLEDWTSNLERYFQAQGYKEARAPYAREASRDGERLAIVFNVSRGPLYVIDTLDVTGNTFFSTPALVAQLGVLPGAPLVQRALDAWVARIADRYQRDGFAGVAVKAAVTTRKSTGAEIRQAVTVAVNEGPRTLVQSVAFVCNGTVARCAVPADALQAALTQRGPDGFAIAPGKAFYLPDLDRARDAVFLAYADRGYEIAAVALPPPDRMVNADRTRADVRFEIREGPQIRVDHVLLVGNNRTKASTIRNELVFKPGDPVSRERLTESQQRISSLGLFRRVRISELQHGTEGRRDVLVIVEESPPTSIAYGGGLELGYRLRSDPNGNAVRTLEAAPRALFDIGRRNLGGKNRALSFNGSLAVRPNLSSGGLVGTGLWEYRALGTYREPRIFGYAADLLMTGGFEQTVRTSYSFSRRGGRAELVHRLSPTFSVYGRYSLEQTHILSEQVSDQQKVWVDRLFPQVRISRLSASLVRDTRDDPFDPGQGVLASIEGDLAPRAIGSQVGFTKSLGQLFVYRKLPTARRIIFAAGARVGVAKAFEQVKNGQVITDLPISERFFAGNTVRGFVDDQLGTPDTLTDKGFPQGGDALLIVNGELRMSVWKELAAVTFVDAGNVFARVHEFDPTDIRPTVGFGFRYKSPLGPIRFDLGFNPNRRTIGGVREKLFVYYISIGQAF